MSESLHTILLAAAIAAVALGALVQALRRGRSPDEGTLAERLSMEVAPPAARGEIFVLRGTFEGLATTLRRVRRGRYSLTEVAVALPFEAESHLVVTPRRLPTSLGVDFALPPEVATLDERFDRALRPHCEPIERADGLLTDEVRQDLLGCAGLGALTVRGGSVVLECGGRESVAELEGMRSVALRAARAVIAAERPDLLPSAGYR